MTELTEAREMTKLEKLLALVDDIELTDDRAVIKMSRDVVVISEGSTLTLNRGLAVSVSRFRHDNPVDAETAFSSLEHMVAPAFLEDLTQQSIEYQEQLMKYQLQGLPQRREGGQHACTDGGCSHDHPPAADGRCTTQAAGGILDPSTAL